VLFSHRAAHSSAFAQRAEQQPDDYLAFLAKMKSDDARRLFGSAGFRAVLDGEYAEMYLSEEVEKSLKSPRS
jgi:hypothetical protein